MVSVCVLKQHMLCGQQQILKYTNIASAVLKQWREMEQCHPGKTPQTRGDLGTESKLDQAKTSHPTSTSTHVPAPSRSATEHQSQGPKMDAISCLEHGPGISRGGPRGDTARDQARHCKVTPIRAQPYPGGVFIS